MPGSARRGRRPQKGKPLAIYHLAVKAVSRSTGRSAVAAAAYRAGERIVNERDGMDHDYRARADVETTMVVAPAAAAWALDRVKLWNAAEVAEVRKDAKVAREYELALPAELDAEQRRAVVQAFAEGLRDRYGIAVDASIHAPHDYGDDRNYHAHVLTTTRVVGAEGMGAKTVQLDKSTLARGEVEAIREMWERLGNDALEAAGVAARIDRRTLAAQGIERLPTMHLGATAAALERDGIPTRRGDHNRAVSNDNDAQARLSAEIVDLKAERDRRAVTQEAPTAASGASVRRIEVDRPREGAREPERAATAAPGGVLTDAAYALASSQQDYEAIAVMRALTQLFEKLRPIAEPPRKVVAPPPTAVEIAPAEIVRRWEAERERQLAAIEAKARRAGRYGDELVRQHERRRSIHQQREPTGLAAIVPGRRKAWEQVRDAIRQRIDRLVAQVDRIEAFDRNYRSGDWESGSAGERLAHRKAAAVLPELARAYPAARAEVVRQQVEQSVAEQARIAQQRREQGRSGFKR